MNIVELLHTTGDRHLTAAERDQLRDCTRQVESAIRIGSAVEAVESSVVEEVVHDLRERHPRFGQLQPQAWEKLAADLQLILRNDVRALRLGDPQSLDAAVLSYLASVYSAYRLSRGFVRECLTSLRDRLTARLSRDDADELRPYLNRNIEVLAAGEEPAAAVV